MHEFQAVLDDRTEPVFLSGLRVRFGKQARAFAEGRFPQEALQGFFQLRRGGSGGITRAAPNCSTRLLAINCSVCMGRSKQGLP